MVLVLQFVRTWNIRQVEHALKNRKVFRWAQHDDSTHWPNASGALGGIEDADQGERIKDYAGLGGSEPGRFRCHSLPWDLSRRRHPSPSLFPLHQRLDRQRARLKGIGEKQCLRNWKERLLSLRAGRAALALQSLSVWPRTERTWPSHTRKVPPRPRRSSRRLNAPAERRSRFRRTPPMPTPAKPRSKGPWRPSADLMCL